ncbi:MAG: tyrosine-protein phosphatase [Novosphingobium sp.]|nr:tyrosine-protein phosphatase [Novosphingobium sp.]
MNRTFVSTFVSVLALSVAAPAAAEEAAVLERIDAQTVELSRAGAGPVAIWLSDDTAVDTGDRLVAAASKDRTAKIALPAGRRAYVILRHEDGSATVVAERVLPLEQGSNFRDIGGYETRDGHTVRWGKAFRSGAMALLTEDDYALIGQLGLDSVVDFRSLEEREIAPDLVDDRTGALFIANDYSLKPLFAKMGQGDGENTYRGMEKLLAPQYRSLFKRLLAGDGAVLYHCSAGQDRTGIATALIYDVLGVDRETILRDYHLSTALRRTQWEMPPLDPADYPDNPMVQYYAKMQAAGRTGAEPLYTPGGASHLAQFFVYLDAEYGGSEGYVKQVLGFSDADIARLRQIMLD